MLSSQDNDLLTRVEGEAPMGLMMRENHWIPCLRAGKLEADGAPERVRLFGENFVAFRATDGRVGLFDEGCPHRGVSLALARNEDCALRCIFHGWKIDVSGVVLETPSECNDPETFARGVKVNHYPVREAGGLIWVWLGKSKPARFPDLPFTHVQAHQVFIATTKLPINWVQALDATLDSAHIAFLHRDWMPDLGERFTATGENLAPRYEFETTPYGMRAAALRPLADGSTHVRIGEFVMPFYSSTLTSVADEGHFQIMVPIDDTHTLWTVVRWTNKPALDGAHMFLAAPGADIDNWVPPLGDADTHWGQDREAMKERSFSGFGGGLLSEDTVVQISMGPIVDRSKEYLSSADTAVARARRLLMQAALDHAAGKIPHGAGADFDYTRIEAGGGLIPGSESWRAAFPHPGMQQPATQVA